MNPRKSTFQQRLFCAMLFGEWSVDDLARAAGISTDVVDAWLRGEVERPEGVHPICAAHVLGVESRWLIDGTGPVILPELEASHATH